MFVFSSCGQNISTNTESKETISKTTFNYQMDDNEIIKLSIDTNNLSKAIIIKNDTNYTEDLYKKKGYDLLIQAVGILKRKYGEERAFFCIVGGSILPEYQKWMAEEDITERNALEATGNR